MRHGSLFSGIGGFDLAAQWMGWENVFQVEIDPFCQKVLEKNFPGVKRYGDIKEFDGTKYRGTIDVLSGGFPCQPFSSAGKRNGTKDHRHLWPEMLRVIREVQPIHVLGENVYGILSWSRGLVFEQVCADLENEGYQVQPVILPACSIDAPHRRDRVWFIAYSESMGRRDGIAENQRKTKRKVDTLTYTNCLRYAPHSNGSGLERVKKEATRQLSTNRDTWSEFPLESPVCGRNDGVPNRVDRIKSLGNAIVPQVAYEIFKAIEMIRK